MDRPPIFDVLGVRLHGMDLNIATAQVLTAVKENRKGYVCVTGVHGVMEAQDDPTFREILNQAFLNTTDGMPLVWLGKRALGPQVDRVYGPDLMLALFEATRDGAVRHFLYGGSEGVAEELKARLESRFPGVAIAGTYTPPFRPLKEEEESALESILQAARVDLLWVGLSTPKQERFMASYLERLPVKVMFGVGAAFDFHSGRVRQAPRWIQRSGFEWLYRLISQPGRLARRYLVNNPRFIWKVARQLMGAG